MRRAERLVQFDRYEPVLQRPQRHPVVVIGSVAFGLIGVGLWVWMAVMNKAGKSWARIVATVLFLLNTLVLLLGVARGGAAASFLVSILTWLIGLGAIILLWRKDSSEYITAQSAPRAR